MKFSQISIYLTKNLTFGLSHGKIESSRSPHGFKITFIYHVKKSKTHGRRLKFHKKKEYGFELEPITFTATLLRDRLFERYILSPAH